MQAEIESTDQQKADARLDAIRQWVETHLKFSDYSIAAASADASFRRYFRLSSAGNSWIIMDAPPDKENCGPFIKVAKLLESAGVHAPHIFSFNETEGFMQLSDLGSTAYLGQLTAHSVDALYRDAIQAIVHMQTIKADLPAYDEALLMFEMSLFNDWYLQKHLALSLNAQQLAVLQDTQQQLVASALSQPVVFVHRDYHSRNLMLLEKNNPGVIDFQDAVNGPASYDLVSLIKDCYIAWPREKQLQWIDLYLELSACQLDRDLFIRQLDLMGMQRHLKAIGIFARLNHRDGKPGYLNDIPRTLSYVIDVCQRYEELSDFKVLLEQLGLQGDSDTLGILQ